MRFVQQTRNYYRSTSICRATRCNLSHPDSFYSRISCSFKKLDFSGKVLLKKKQDLSLTFMLVSPGFPVDDEECLACAAPRGGDRRWRTNGYNGRGERSERIRRQRGTRVRPIAMRPHALDQSRRSRTRRPQTTSIRTIDRVKLLEDGVVATRTRRRSATFEAPFDYARPARRETIRAATRFDYDRRYTRFFSRMYTHANTSIVLNRQYTLQPPAAPRKHALCRMLMSSWQWSLTHGASHCLRSTIYRSDVYGMGTASTHN